MASNGMQIFGASYFVNHTRKLLHSNGNKGPIDHELFKEQIIRKIAGKTLATYCNIIGSGTCQGARWGRKLSSIDCEIEKRAVDDMWKVHRFLMGHRPGAVIGIGQIEAIAGMRRMGLNKIDDYIGLLDELDAAPPRDFSEFVDIVKEFKKEITA